MRRTMIIGLVALVAVNAGTAFFARTLPRRAPPEEGLSLVYVGARDCAPCQAWDRDRRPDLVSSGALQRVAFREIVVDRLADLRSPQTWPGEAADLRRHFEPLGVPQWLLLRGDAILGKAAGLSQWDERMRPLLRYVAGR